MTLKQLQQTLREYKTHTRWDQYTRLMDIERMLYYHNQGIIDEAVIQNLPYISEILHSYADGTIDINEYYKWPVNEYLRFRQHLFTALLPHSVYWNMTQERHKYWEGFNHRKTCILEKCDDCKNLFKVGVDC